VVESQLQDHSRKDLSPLAWCIDRVGDTETSNTTIPIAASKMALTKSDTLAVVIPVSNAKPPPNQVLQHVNELLQPRDQRFSSGEVFLESNDMSIEREEVLVADNATNSQVAETAINSSSTTEDELTRVNALKKHPYNYHMKQGAKSGLIWNRPVRKNILSHNQVICLIQHVLDPADVPLFVTSLETIKLSNGQFPNVVPLSVKKDIFDKFCCSKNAGTRVDVVDMYDSDHIEVSQVEAKDVGKAKVHSNKNNHFQTLFKHLFGQLHIVWIGLYLIENNIPWKIHHSKSWELLLIMHFLSKEL